MASCGVKGVGIWPLAGFCAAHRAWAVPQRFGSTDVGNSGRPTECTDLPGGSARRHGGGRRLAVESISADETEAGLRGRDVRRRGRVRVWRAARALDERDPRVHQRTRRLDVERAAGRCNGTGGRGRAVGADQDYRRLTLETGAANEGATEFYAALGYQMEQVVLSKAIPAPSPL